MPSLQPSRAPLWQRLPIYLLAFLVPPMAAMLLVGTTTFSSLNRHRTPEAIEPSESAIPPSPALDPKKRQVVILLSHAGTQLTEAVIAHDLLSRVPGVQTVTCAPQRALAATTGPVGLLPDFDLEKCPEPDAIVLPSMTDPSHAARLEWLKRVGPKARWILTLGEGARLAALSGLLPPGPVAVHFSALESLAREFPATDWRAERWRSEGRFLSSEGAFTSFDAVTELVRQMAGASAARALRSQVPWPEALPADAPPAEPASLGDFLPLIRNSALHWWRRKVAIAIQPGLDAIPLALLLEPLPRSMNTQAYTLAEFRAHVPTSGGLLLIPSTSAGTAEVADQLIVLRKKPESSNSSTENLMQPLIVEWARTHQVDTLALETSDLSEFTRRWYRQLETWDGRDTTRLIARSLRLPQAIESAWLSEPATTGSTRSATPLLALLGALGVLAAAGLSRRKPKKA